MFIMCKLLCLILKAFDKKIRDKIFWKTDFLAQDWSYFLQPVAINNFNNLNQSITFISISMVVEMTNIMSWLNIGSKIKIVNNNLNFLGCYSCLNS